MNITVTNLRKGPFGTALAFFDVVLDNTFVVKSFALKKKNDGSKYYYQAPSKLRTDKAGNPVKDKNNFNVYDSYFDLYAEQAGEEYKITSEAWEGRDAILEQAMALFETETPKSGTGSAAKTKATATATAAAKTGTSSSTEDADAEDDDLPF